MIGDINAPSEMTGRLGVCSAMIGRGIVLDFDEREINTSEINENRVLRNGILRE